MREYLTTTTLGDLQRKSKEITLPEETINTQETAAPTSTFNQSADASPFSSMIRGGLEKSINKKIYCDYNATSPYPLRFSGSWVRGNSSFKILAQPTNKQNSLADK